MNPINLLCPHCGYEELVEPEVMDDDELECSHCSELIFDEGEDISTFAQWVAIGNALKHVYPLGKYPVFNPREYRSAFDPILGPNVQRKIKISHKTY